MTLGQLRSRVAEIFEAPPETIKISFSGKIQTADKSFLFRDLKLSEDKLVKVSCSDPKACEKAKSDKK
jgi:hypothetical protein